MPLPRTLLEPTLPEDLDLRLREGAWPDGVTGELLLSAPHPNTFDAPHPFFGEGVLHRLSLRPGTNGAPADRFAWRRAVTDTPSARLRARRPDVFTPTLAGVTSPFGVVNAANTAPLVWGDRLFTTWDVGRPVEVDPASLGFLGEVGHREDWRVFEIGSQPILPMVMSTAHPVVDPERDVMWTVNTFWGQLEIVRWDGHGRIERWPIEDALIPQSVHTITQTRDWIIVGDCAFKVEPQVLTGGARTEPANHDAPLFLIRKDRLEATPPGEPVPCTTLRIAPEINHYYGVWDDTDGVRILFEHTENSDLAMTQRATDLDALGRPCDPRLQGLYGFPMSPDRTTVLVIDPDRGEVLHHAEQRRPDLLWGRQLNAMDWSLAGLSAPTLHHTVHQGWRPEAITQEMLALYGDRVDRSVWPADETPPLVVSSERDDLGITAVWELAPDDMPTSPIFVPRDTGDGDVRPRDTGANPGGHDGWIVVPILNDDGLRIELFEADGVDRGPIAVLDAEGTTLPFVLHSAWMPRAVPAEELPRVRFRDELERIGELPDDLARVVLDVADDLDEGAPMEAPVG